MEDGLIKNNEDDETIINIDISVLPEIDVKFFIECYKYLEWINLTHILSFRVLDITDTNVIIEMKEKRDIDVNKELFLVDILNISQLSIVNNILKLNPTYNKRENIEQTISTANYPKELCSCLNEVMLSLVKDNCPKLYFKYIHQVNYKDKENILFALEEGKLSSFFGYRLSMNMHNINLNIKQHENALEYFCYSIRFENVINLTLKNCSIGDDELKYICNNINMFHLIKLVLNQNHITSRGVMELANNCCKMKVIKDLQLSSNKIETNGVEYLSKYLKYCLKLENLTLEDNLITDTATMQFRVLVKYPYRRLFIRM